MNSIFGIDQLLIELQGDGTPFWDLFLGTYSNIYVWCPLFLVLFCILIKNNTLRDFLTIVGIISAMVLLAEYAIIPLWEYLSHTASARGDIISSHITSMFAVVLFVSSVIKKRTLATSLLLWVAACICSGVYQGEYQPGNITIPVLLGCVLGILVSMLYKFVRKKQRGGMRDWISTQYTKSGYLVSDIHFLLVVLYGTSAFVPVIAFISTIL